MCYKYSRRSSNKISKPCLINSVDTSPGQGAFPFFVPNKYDQPFWPLQVQFHCPLRQICRHTYIYVEIYIDTSPSSRIYRIFQNLNIYTLRYILTPLHLLETVVGFLPTQFHNIESISDYKWAIIWVFPRFLFTHFVVIFFITKIKHFSMYTTVSERVLNSRGNFPFSVNGSG